jgi:hypothetical protein
MGFMYYNTPFSLFPPNAAISLTDDNSTSFAARPAAFGPKLAAQGLSGELWVGNGFPDDTLDGNGELGCSDMVAWSSKASLKSSLKAAARSPITTDPTVRTKRSDQSLDSDAAKAKPRLADVIVDDGTDDYLHAGLTSSGRDSSTSAHADIQSIQEAAEIKGKIVLLMRGGCGFLQKVMWAQRRGAVAVIVGDNQKGGPLIQMFAHGDEVENVTIPSVFTARTTAHLLSSLTQPGSFIEDLVDENGNSILRVQRVPSTNSKTSQIAEKTQQKDRRTASPESSSTVSRDKQAQNKWAPISKHHKRSWLSRLLSFDHRVSQDSSAKSPRGSGRLGRVLTEDWSAEKERIVKGSIKSYKADVQKPTKPSSKDQSANSDRPQGGSITPGSGEYTISKESVGEDSRIKSQISRSASAGKARDVARSLYEDEEDEEDDVLVNDAVKSHITEDGDDEVETAADQDDQFPRPHEGLWVTITPTSSATSFFDTLLVLVISPLITLTVVYALLLLRARIRRRRWRAPKSVVERLPVRTYQAVAPSPSRSPTRSPRLPSPTSASPTTPLLQQTPTRSRPRSRTTTGVLDTENLAAPSSAMQTPQSASRSSPREHEKGAGGFSAEWRKYMGRQVECVVCLEEYVDGVSRVMSLPCGHEFHVDCM